MDLETRGKSRDTVGRAQVTAKAVERLTPRLLRLPVTQFGDRAAFEFRAARLDGGAKRSTINRHLRTLRVMLKRARPDYRMPRRIFFADGETRVRWLRPEDEITVIEPMRSPFREMAKLAALTLMRQGEVRLLRREQVRLEHGGLLLPQPKGELRAVVLSTDAQRLLREHFARNPSPWVFPSPAGPIS